MPNWLFEPLTKAPSRFAKKQADKIDNPQGEGGRMRGFAAGAMEGAGDLASDFTSPFSIAGSLAGGASGMVAKMAKRATPAIRAASEAAPYMGRSLAKIYEGANLAGKMREPVREISEAAPAAKRMLKGANAEIEMMPKGAKYPHRGGFNHEVYDISNPGDITHGMSDLSEETVKRLLPGAKMPIGPDMDVIGEMDRAAQAAMKNKRMIDMARQKSRMMRPRGNTPKPEEY